MPGRAPDYVSSMALRRLLLILLISGSSAVAEPEGAPAGEQPATTPAVREATPDISDTDFEKLLSREIEGANAAQKPNWFWQFIRTLITLVFLLAIFYGLFRIWKFRQELPQRNYSAMRTLYDYPLGPDKSVRIVELANRLLVLGVSGAGIQLITEISEKHRIDEIRLAAERDNSQEVPDFVAELTRSIRSGLEKMRGGSRSHIVPPEVPIVPPRSRKADRESLRQKLFGEDEDA